MAEYDVVVIGGGPSGLTAAKTVAEQGLKVLLLEEDGAVGVHWHRCFYGSRFTERIIKTVHPSVIQTPVVGRRIYNAEGKLLAEVPNTGWGGYLVRSKEFDKEIAKQAAKAGAEIHVKTKVTGLIKEKGVVVGVSLKSEETPEVRAKLVICADGLVSCVRGFAREELNSPYDEKPYGLMSAELANVADVELGMLESHLGVYGQWNVGSVNLQPFQPNTMRTSFPSYAEFQTLKRTNSTLGRKIRDAAIIHRWDIFDRVDRGKVMPQIVKDGIMFVGDATGGHNMNHAMMSAILAGRVAVEAIKDGNVTREKLIAYEEAHRQLGVEKGAGAAFPEPTTPHDRSGYEKKLLKHLERFMHLDVE